MSIINSIKRLVHLAPVNKPVEKKENNNKINNATPVVPQLTREWTVLYYFAGNNNLGSMAVHSFNSLVKVGSDDNVNLVAELPGIRGLIRKENEPKKIQKTPVRFSIGTSEDLGKIDMGDPATLKNFIKWAVNNYPAKNFSLVLWNHGGGFKGSMTDDKTKHLIDNKELAQALTEAEKETGKKINILNFNACLMNQIEVNNEIKNCVDYVVGSEETEAGLVIPIPFIYGTTPQHLIAKDLKDGIKERGNISPEELAKLYVYESEHQFGSSFFTPTQSAINTSKIEDVKTAADNLAKALLDEIKGSPDTIKKIRSNISKTQRFIAMDMYAEPYSDFGDLGDFARVIKNSKHYQNPEIKKSAETLLESVKKAVISEHHALESPMGGKSLAGSTGLSVYLSRDYGYDLPGKNPIDNIPNGGTHGYEKTSFAQETQWDELLKAISKNNDWYGKLAAKSPPIESNRSLLLRLAQFQPYQEAIGIIHGQTKPSGLSFPLQSPLFPLPFFVPFPAPSGTVTGILGGALTAKKGISKLISSTKDYSQTDKLKLAASGAFDTVAGLGSITVCGLLLGGLINIAIPAAFTLFTLGTTKAVVGVGGSFLKAYQTSQKKVSEKLKEIEEEKLPANKNDLSFINKLNNLLYQTTDIDFSNKQAPVSA